MQLWHLVAALLCILPDVHTLNLTIKNADTVNKWFYQCHINVSNVTITALSVRSASNDFGHDEDYITCIQESWEPYPWTCLNHYEYPFIPPLSFQLSTPSETQTFLGAMPDLLSETSILLQLDSSHTLTTTTTAPAANDTDNNYETLPTFEASYTTPTRYVSYITSTLCGIGYDTSCLASIGLPGFSLSAYNTHPYSVLVFGSYIVSQQQPISALQFWFNPTSYLSTDTIESLTGDAYASDSKLRLYMHNLYALSNIKILFSTFGPLDASNTTDNWIESIENNTTSIHNIARDLASITREYWFDGINLNTPSSITNSILTSQSTAAETSLIILTNALHSALNRMSEYSYFLVTQSAPSTLFATSNATGFQLIHQFTSDIISWYNIEYYDSFNTSTNSSSHNRTYHSFNDMFLRYPDSAYNLFRLGFDVDKVVVARSASRRDSALFLDADAFEFVLQDAVLDATWSWTSGFMLYDFYADLETAFSFSLQLEDAFSYIPEDSNNYTGWGDWYGYHPAFLPAAAPSVTPAPVASSNEKEVTEEEQLTLIIGASAGTLVLLVILFCFFRYKINSYEKEQLLKIEELKKAKKAKKKKSKKENKKRSNTKEDGLIEQALMKMTSSNSSKRYTIDLNRNGAGGTSMSYNQIQRSIGKSFIGKLSKMKRFSITKTRSVAPSILRDVSMAVPAAGALTVGPASPSGQLSRDRSISWEVEVQDSGADVRPSELQSMDLETIQDDEEDDEEDESDEERMEKEYPLDDGEDEGDEQRVENEDPLDASEDGDKQTAGEVKKHATDSDQDTDDEEAQRIATSW